MPTIAFIGAGSTVFTRELLTDIFSFPELHDSRIVLHDIDAERLETSAVVARHVAAKAGAPATISATLDRCRALEGAD